ncbi:ABC transport system permease protein [Clostridium aceticum]|uniref:ABC transport system permease protein n=1 Tax=Clostridium aceticum TaxID=84022 RepID=A0A0D8I7V0_9CLOT|nr:ABC transporter permease [Clostridium aceticum]AKL97320.1 ABC transport system permease protein [Clostridium aceticum]KJF26335.1 ABC transporter permease [Clostridium aceticum]
MIKVKNKRIIRNLAFKSFRASKTRNLMAIIAIALTTVLFTSLFTISMGMVESFQKHTVRQAGGDGHAVLKYITDEQYNNMKGHPLIDEISYNKVAADRVDNPEFLKRPVEMYYMDEIAMKLGFCQPTTGDVPVKANEIITDTKTLDLLGVPHETGAQVPLTYTIKGEHLQTTFILSGFWESDPVFNTGFIIVSHGFMDLYADKFENTFKVDGNMTGSINAYIMFKNSFNIEEKLYRVISDGGYTIPKDNEKSELIPTDIVNNVNWAYLSSNFSKADPVTMISVLILLLLIMSTGYLIIYNIFQISVIKDIKLYGLLKTIGTTSKQIKRMISCQAILLAVIGIPIGLCIGFLLGKVLLPMVMGVTSFGGENAIVSLNPFIFIGASIFALITVFISIQKPGKIAGKVSPIEAVRYSENSQKTNKNTKETTDGGKLWKMALSNLGRNKKRTIIAIISMTLSLVLLNSVFTISSGFDMDKYISKFVDADFLIGHANYFNLNHFRFEEDELSESFISEVEKEEGFEEGGRIYYNIYVGDCSIYREDPNELSYFGDPLNEAMDGQPKLDLYGMEDFPLLRLDIVEGKLDIEKLKSGKYIIEGVHEGDHGDILWNTSHYGIGNTVKITVDGKEHEYEVMAKARIKTYSMSTRFFDEFAMYLPEEEYLKIVTKPVVMTYAFNVEDGKEEDMEKLIKEYINKTEPLMNYESKQTYVDNFKDLQNMLIVVGGILSFINGLIGILNFINAMFTSIWARRKEFAMLQSIGMTGKQLKKMLCFEGLYYAGYTMILSLILGIIFSVGVIWGIISELWFFSYKFIVSPLLITYPILIALSLVVPYVAFYSIKKGSAIERLREIE